MSKGFLIVFVGIDGSGKTTQARILYENLEREGKRVSYVWSRWKPFLLRYFINKWKKRVKDEYSETESGSRKFKSRKQGLMEKPLFRWAWLTLFFLDYGLQIFIKVRSRLLMGRIVISDRIFYDSMIDQAVNLNKRKDFLLERLDSLWIRTLFPKPDIAIYVDCPEETAFARKQDDPDIGYLTDRRNLYLELTERYKWIKVDGALPVQEIAEEVKKIVNGELKT